MKKFILCFITITLYVCSTYAQNINGRFSSSIYSFEQFDTDSTSSKYVRAFEMLNLNVNYDKFSLKTYTNLEADLGKKVDDLPLARFYTFYFEGRDLFDALSFKLGRQPLFNNVATGNFDGLNLDYKSKWAKVSAYGGGNVPLYQKLELNGDLKNNYVVGGKVTVPVDNFKVDLGYVKKNFKAENYYATRFDANLNPIQVLIESKSLQYQFATANVAYEMPKYFNANVRYDYDINYEKSSKFEFEGRYVGVKDLGVDVYYNYREPRINYNSIFSVFDFGNSQEIEGGVDYKITPLISVAGKYGFVQFKTENSQRITLAVNTNYGSVSFRKTLGNAGELDAVSLYTAYTFLEGLLTPSVGVTYTSYKLAENYSTDNLTTVLIGTNIRPYRTLSFDVQGQYMNNKIYKDDWRFFLRLNYWFNTNLNL